MAAKQSSIHTKFIHSIQLLINNYDLNSSCQKPVSRLKPNHHQTSSYSVPTMNHTWSNVRRPINKPGWKTSYSHWITAMKMMRRSCPPLSISPASTHQTHNQTLVKSQSKSIRKRSVLIVAYCTFPRHENLEVFTMLESLDVLA